MSTVYQKEVIRKHLLDGNSITQIQAFKLCRTTRLATHIHKLRCEGYDIFTTMHYDNGTCYGEYVLIKNRKQYIELLRMQHQLKLDL